jgi:hypothetical protein
MRSAAVGREKRFIQNVGYGEFVYQLAKFT